MLENHQEPGRVSPPIIQATLASAGMGDRRLRELVVWSLIAVLAGIGITGFLLYWFLTADVRMERDAVATLFSRAQFAHVSVGSQEPRLIELRNKNWAREYYIFDSPRWDMKPTGSKAFPFEAIITVPYQRYATIYHDIKQVAEADDQFYQAADDRMFFEKPEGYRRLFSPSKMRRIIDLTYNSSGCWINKCERTEEDKE